MPDGATIQFGIGGTSNVVGLHLKDKKDLGVHTEMLTDSMMELYEQGVITGRRKTFHPGKIVCGFSVGTKKLYDFMDNNPICEFAPIHYTNSVDNIARNDNMVSINNTLTVDLTGQCASESLGHSMYSGTGGQVDFIRGAAKVEGRHVVRHASLDIHDEKRQDLAHRLPIPSGDGRDDAPVGRAIHRDRVGNRGPEAEKHPVPDQGDAHNRPPGFPRSAQTRGRTGGPALLSRLRKKIASLTTKGRDYPSLLCYTPSVGRGPIALGFGAYPSG